MKNLRISLLVVFGSLLLISCAETAMETHYVDVDGDGDADIEYTVENGVNDLDDSDVIIVDGTVVTNAETNEEWDIVDEQALENSFDNIKNDLNEFGKDVREGAEDLGNEIEEGAEDVGNEIEEATDGDGH